MEMIGAAILGAGAAGLMAGIRAGELGRKVALFEKNKRPGVKILMSGGTRCNITHDTDARGIVREYGPSGKFLHSPLAAFGIADTLELFHAEGVATKVEETGKIFPVSNKASDVLDALVRRLQRAGTPLYLEEPVTELRRSENGFDLQTPKRRLRAAKVLITTGGLSYPGSGTTGDGYGFAQQLGHRLIAPVPALVPIATGDQTVADLRGITLPDVGVQVLHDQTPLAQRRGSLLFAHFGLSGPVILDVSRAVSRRKDGAKLILEIDLWPEQTETQIGEYLRDESLRSGKKQLAQIVAPHLPRRVCELILQRASLPLDRKSAALTKEDRRGLVAQIKHWRLPIAGTLGFKKAEVTAGGVPLDEVDSRTMQSKLVPNLYFAGEILDLDGPIGGYNFQAAWSTGWLAGSSL